MFLLDDFCPPAHAPYTTQSSAVSALLRMTCFPVRQTDAFAVQPIPPGSPQIPVCFAAHLPIGNTSFQIPACKAAPDCTTSFATEFVRAGFAPAWYHPFLSHFIIFAPNQLYTVRLRSSGYMSDPAKAAYCAEYPASSPDIAYAGNGDCLFHHPPAHRCITRVYMH